MLQKRLTAKITVMTAVLSLGMSAMAVAGVSAPTDPASGPCGPSTCLPDEPTPTPDPCFDNPDPIYYETYCVDQSPDPDPGGGSKPTNEATDRTSPLPDECRDFEVCNGSTPPRPDDEITRPG